MEQLQLDLTKLRSELKRVGYRPEGGSMDPAALRTELEHRDREIVTKVIRLLVLCFSFNIQYCPLSIYRNISIMGGVELEFPNYFIRE